MPLADFSSRYEAGRLDYDRNRLTGAQYWATVAGDAVQPLSNETAAELISLDVASRLVLDERMLTWAEALRAAGISTAILSNMPSDVLAGLRRLHGSLLEKFNPALFSCEFGEVKPEPAIYRRLLNSLSLSPQRVLFIDDNPANVHAAIEAGLHAIRYDSFDTLPPALAKFALPN